MALASDGADSVVCRNVLQATNLLAVLSWVFFVSGGYLP